MQLSSPEQGPARTPDSGRSLNVLQPHKAESLSMLIAEINDIPSEQTGEDRSGDWSGADGATTTQGAQQAAHISARDLAIANLPEPVRMQRELEAHIRSEVKGLRKQAGAIIRSRKPGSAYALAVLYAKIRRLNALLAELLEASVDVLKRFFIRVFIDKQSIH